MILVCPSCDTRYFADDSAIGKDGRRVRCASCGHSWFVKPPEDGAPPAPPPEETGLTREQVERLRQTAAANSAARSGPHAEFRAREHAKRQRARARAATIAWAVGVVVFVGVAGAAVTFRDQVAERWPRAASFYKMVGLDVNRFGLDLEGVDAKRSFDGTTPVLTVFGEAVNPGAERRAAPGVRISLRDEAGDELHAWTDTLGVESIGPGERVAFTSRIVAPPIETFRLSVRFDDGAGDGDAAMAAETAIPAAEDGAVAADRAPGLESREPAGYEEPPWSGGDGDPDDPLPPEEAGEGAAADVESH